MPPTAGEQTLLTLFADIHYALTPPHQHPRHSRFEKSSYVYLYTTHSLTARLEAANNPGTPHQDAFNGSLAHTSITYQHRQPNLVTLDLMRRADEQGMWQLHSNGRLELVHTLDIYFWTASDAESFVDACSKLAVGEVSIDGQKRENRAGEHRDNMSPVVQKLEQAAISSPQPTHYKQDSVATVESGVLGHHQSNTPGFPPPPSGPHTQQHTPAPLAYNPAAPPAPEPIAHREKTPPPVDAGTGTGLNGVVYQDQGYGGQGPQGMSQQQYGGYQSQHTFSPPPLQHQGSFPPPPPSQHATPPNHASAYPSPPPSQQSVQQSYTPAHSFSQHQAPSASPHSFHQQHQQPQQPQHSFASPPTSPGFPPQAQRTNSLPFQQYASPPTSPGHPPTHVPSPYQPALGSPAINTGNATHPSNPNYPNYGSPSPGHQSTQSYQSPQTHQPNHSQQMQQQHQQSSYTSTPQSPGFPPNAQSIHSQVYQPTDAELAGTPKPNVGTGGQAPGKLEGRADRLEKGVNRFLKRLDRHL